MLFEMQECRLAFELLHEDMWRRVRLEEDALAWDAVSCIRKFIASNYSHFD